MSEPRQTISVDFDGVLHSYQQPWVNAHTIPDAPVGGAMEWLRELLQSFEVVVCTTRAKTWRGRRAIRGWLKEYYRGASGEVGLESLKISYEKLPAIVYVDDRAYRFNGRDFPSVAALRGMRPWGKA